MWAQVKQALYQSVMRFLTTFASLLPGLAAIIVALLLSILLAWIVSAVVRRLLTSIQFDQQLVRSGFPGLAEWSPMRSPTLLASRVVASLIILAGFLIGIAAFDAELTRLLVRAVFGYLPNMLGAILVLLVGNIIARFLARSVLIGAVNMNFQYGRLLSVGVKWLLIVMAFAMSLELLKISPRIVELAFGILFGGIVLALVLTVSLNSRELVTKSLERDSKKNSTQAIEDPLRHL